MKLMRLNAFVLSLFSVYWTPSLAADRFAVELATPPIWFFREHWPPFGGIATCTAVNLHKQPITLTTQLIIHDDDGFPFPILNNPEGTITQVVGPNEATEVTVVIASTSLDAHLARCVFKYKGNPNLVKAAVVLDDTPGRRTITAPAELARKVLMPPDSTEN